MDEEPGTSRGGGRSLADPSTGSLAVFEVGAGSVLVFYAVHDWLSTGERFWLFTALFALIAGLGIWYFQKDRVLDVFAPIIPSTLLLYLYAASSALFAGETGATLYGDPVGREVLETYYLACLIGVTGLSVGNLLGRLLPTSLPRWLTIDANWADAAFFRQVRVVAPVVALVCLPWVLEAFDFVNVKGYAETALEGRVLKREQGSSQPLLEVFLQQVPLTLMLVLGVLLLFRSRSWLWRGVGAAILAAHVATVVLGGQRGAAVAAGTLVVVFVHYRIRRMKAWTMAGVFVGGYLVTNALAFVRSTTDPGEMLALLRLAWDRGDSAFLSLANSGEFAVGQNLMRLISGMQEGVTRFTYGTSLLTEALVFVPRALLPWRPLNLSEQFVVVFYPGVRETGGGYGFFNLMEGYWALGLPGVFLFMIGFGFVMSTVYRAFTEGKITDFTATWYASVFYVLVLASVRTGVVTSLKVAVLASIPFALLLVARRWFPVPAGPTQAR